MKRTLMQSVDEAMEMRKTMPYAMITRLSEVTLGNMPETVSKDEMLEARFFGENGEIHIFYENGEQKAVYVTDEGNSEKFPPIDHDYDLLSGFGRKLTVRQYVDFDEEGQAYISAIRLLRWEG